MNFLDSLFAVPWYWLVAGLVLMSLELLGPGVFFLWIGIGAAAVGLVLMLFPTLPLEGQIIVLLVFMVGSVLVGVRVQARNKANAAIMLNTGLNQYVGRRVVAVQAFQSGRGRIKVDDTTYPAQSDSPVESGDQMVVQAVHNGVFQVVRLGGSS